MCMIWLLWLVLLGKMKGDFNRLSSVLVLLWVEIRLFYVVSVVVVWVVESF